MLLTYCSVLQHSTSSSDIMRTSLLDFLRACIHIRTHTIAKVRNAIVIINHTHMSCVSVFVFVYRLHPQLWREVSQRFPAPSQQVQQQQHQTTHATASATMSSSAPAPRISSHAMSAFFDPVSADDDTGDRRSAAARVFGASSKQSSLDKLFGENL